MTLRDVLDRMELMRAVGIRKECPDCGATVRASVAPRAEFERLQLDIEIALRRERETVTP